MDSDSRITLESLSDDRNVLVSKTFEHLTHSVHAHVNKFVKSNYENLNFRHRAYFLACALRAQQETEIIKLNFVKAKKHHNKTFQNC